MLDALKFIIKSIVDNPDKVEVRQSEEEGVTNFIIKVAKDDMGKVIGKEGKVIRAIRNVMKIPAIKQDRRIQISLEEET
ncbi:MAG: hypothetical protein UU21_C0001G0080 [Candidatus Levybacteria bacterium GW2011_GWA2_40_8]|nr:MAG: hypothetical protein UU21_C0001G0080 [Candidatus Levybacteria bacterium GW2011_GWA2_40_8]